MLAETNLYKNCLNSNIKNLLNQSLITDLTSHSSLHAFYISKINYSEKGGGGVHSAEDSILASHSAALGLNPIISENFSEGT